MRIRIALFCLLTALPAALFAQEASLQTDAATDPAAGQADLLRGQFLAPRAFRAAAAKVHPSLVTIESFGGLSAGTTKGSIGGIRKPGDGPTTGLIISEDGYVITSSFNFIRQQPIITVVMQDGSRHVAELLGRDEIRKLCVLKIKNAAGLPVPAIAPREEVRVGQWAISVGVGFGDSEPAISAGIISARKRASGRAEQTDANISPANYGGPLIDIEGRVLGICVPMNPKSQEAGAGVEWYDSGIGFAVPLDGAEKFYHRHEGRPHRPSGPVGRPNRTGRRGQRRQGEESHARLGRRQSEDQGRRPHHQV